jgi:hypothetical protein
MRRIKLALCMATTCVFFAGVPSSALAATPAAAWSLDSFAYPTDFAAADNARCESTLGNSAYESTCDTYVVTATDIGAKPMGIHEVVISDTLPPGVTARNVSLLWSGVNVVPGQLETVYLAENNGNCTIAPSLQCKLPISDFTGRTVHPDDTLKMYINVTVNQPEAPGSLVNGASVTGGGASEVSTTSENTLGLMPPPFGFTAFDSPLLAQDGTPETQAGAHPYELTTQFDLASVLRESPEEGIKAVSIHDIRDVLVDLPLGLAGSAVSAPTCTLHQLATQDPNDPENSGISDCPADTIVGHVKTYPTGNLSAASPIYNIVPEHGVAAEFGFVSNVNTPIVLYASIVPTPAGYVLRTSSREITQIPITQITANIYGDPAARDGSGEPAIPTFTNPADCSGEPLKTVVHMDSWASPGTYNPDGSPNFEDPNWAKAEYESPPVTGCAALEGSFNPTIQAEPESTRADSPTGLQVNLSIPQSEGVETLGTPPLKNAVVTLPEGMTVNPSSANGLTACSEAEVGVSASGVPNAAAPTCANSSKIGTVEVETPALPAEACKEPGKGLDECPQVDEREKTPLHGSIYLARQNENPFGSLIAAYFVIDDSRTGVIVKIPAKVELNEATGRLTTVVPNTPQFPFSQLRTHIFGGATASLSTPPTCGAYTLTSQLTPWSAPESGPPSEPSSNFEVNQAADGGACSAPGFAPSFAAGTSDSQAGGFTPLNVSISRQDGEQTIGGISVTAPPGVLGSIKNVVQCPEPQASEGNCGPESLIGEATTAVGAGPSPYWVHGGRVYLTGPYNNGPFGLSIVVPTTAGPFTLTGLHGGFGKEVVRSSIRINQTTGQITVVSDPLPQKIQGIPLQIRTVNVSINRPSFTFNATNCSQLSASASITSAGGATVTPSTPYYASNCSKLPFHPTLAASVGGKASKANGASFTVKVASTPGQANIAKTDLTLPIALPSRLTTIQKACVAAVFGANPAACDEGSVIGTATVHTPLLKSPLTGPGYLVSHGGAAFPDVEFVLQGEGVKLILDGATDIKKGITYSKFNTVPDAPIETFEAVLPTGPHSALTANVPEKANYSLCGANLVMPTVITGQNGAVINQNTKIAITGCPKALKATRAQKLAKALKECRKKNKAKGKKKKRLSCEKQARKKYGTVTKKARKGSKK